MVSALRPASSADSVDNVRVVTNDYDAENGRFAGAQTMITSKSGTNALHGSLFIAIHRPGLNAHQPAVRTSDGTRIGVPLRDNSRFNQWGGSLGGPIIKDRLFAFFSYETLRNNADGLITRGTIGGTSFNAAIIGLTGGDSTIVNLGTVRNVQGGTAIYLRAGGTITNGAATAAAALITGSVGIYIHGSAAVVGNFGTIAGNIGVELYGGGVFTNGASGSTGALVSAAQYGVLLDQTGTFSNFGTVAAGSLTRVQHPVPLPGTDHRADQGIRQRRIANGDHPEGGGDVADRLVEQRPVHEHAGGQGARGRHVRAVGTSCSWPSPPWTCCRRGCAGTSTASSSRQRLCSARAEARRAPTPGSAAT